MVINLFFFRHEQFAIWISLTLVVPSLLGDGDKGFEIVYGEEKFILFWADWSSQD
jgi:hypothetical protein